MEVNSRVKVTVEIVLSDEEVEALIDILRAANLAGDLKLPPSDGTGFGLARGPFAQKLYEAIKLEKMKWRK